ncbi:hypothetical protein VSS93_29815, partial [Pseudomonas syringae pv. tagetis]
PARPTPPAAPPLPAPSGPRPPRQSAPQFLPTDAVILGILVLAVIAVDMELGLRALQRKLVPWQVLPR